MLERRHILRDEAVIMRYRELIAIIRVSKLVFCNCCLLNERLSILKNSWGKRQMLKYYQEFLSELEEFVEEDECCCILDNCKIHKMLQSLARLMNVFNDRYKFLPRYSPLWNNPIELAFSQWKRYLRSGEHIILRDSSDPIAEINQAFCFLLIFRTWIRVRLRRRQ